MCGGSTTARALPLLGIYPASLAPVTGRPRHREYLGTLADVLAPQLDHFAPADTAPRGQQNKRFHAIGLDCVGQGSDLGHRQDGRVTLARGFITPVIVLGL